MSARTECGTCESELARALRRGRQLRVHQCAKRLSEFISDFEEPAETSASSDSAGHVHIIVITVSQMPLLEIGYEIFGNFISEASPVDILLEFHEFL